MLSRSRRGVWRCSPASATEDKAQIVEEIEASGDSVCTAARRRGLSPQQLFGWRRQLREARRTLAEEVPAIVPLGIVDDGEQMRHTAPLI